VYRPILSAIQWHFWNSIRRRRPCAGLLTVFALLAAPLPVKAAPPIAVFGREDFYTLDAGQTSKLKNSGFNTAILFVVDVEANGDLNYNGNHLIVTNGVYMGDPNWGARLAALKVPPTSITRIEVCTGGAGAQSWANIRNLIATNGTGPTSILYKNFLTLRNALGIDAINNDDEVAYHASSAATFNQMITTLGMKNTLCPYNNVSYWQSVFNNSVIDAVYLQCYDGGAGNNPATWNGYFGGFQVAPGNWSNDGMALFESKFNSWSPVINGGFIWQFEFISASDLAAYGAIIKKAVDPLVVTPSAGFSGVAAYNLHTFPVSMPFALTNRGSSSLDWSVINTSSWLTVSSPLGTLATGATTSVTINLVTPVATNLAQGVYSANVVFSNRTTGITVSRSFSLNTAVANWPIALSGNNAAILASNNATAGAPGATAFDLPNNYCFYQQGLSGSTRGLPLNGVFPDRLDGSTAFKLGPYGATNALMLGNTYPGSGTLTLSDPQAYNSLAILAASANGGGPGTFVLNYTNGAKSQVFAFNSQDWFNVITNVAIQGFGRLKLGASLSVEDNGDLNPNLYQTTVNLAALGITQAIASITFSNRAGAGAGETAAIFGVSGMPASIPLSAPLGVAAVPGTNGTVQLSWKPSAGATSYNVRQSLVSGSGHSLIQSTTGTNYNVTGLTNGTTYYFVVSAAGTVSESANSSEVKAMPGSYPGWTIAASPVGYWPLGDVSGTVSAELIQGSNGVYSGGYTLTTGGAVGDGFGSPHRIVSFNGTTGYAQIPRLIGQTNFSIVFWVRTTTAGGTPNWYNGKGLVDGEVGGVQNDFGVALVGAKVGFGIGNADVTLTSLKSINDNLWHQVVVTRDSGSGAMRIYIDGALDNSMTGPIGPRTTPTSLRLGSLQTGINFLAGSMSDVAMYQQVLSSNQVATLYSAATGLFYDVTLSNQWNGTNLVLSWPGNGKLLETTNLTGPWTTNITKSPVNVLPAGEQRFFKIQTQ
jgi:hypothetical protein